MLSKEIRRIMRENKRFTDMLEEYDRTGRFPLEKVRKNFTLKRMTVDKLKRMSNKTGKSMSAVIESIVEKA